MMSFNAWSPTNFPRKKLLEENQGKPKQKKDTYARSLTPPCTYFRLNLYLLPLLPLLLPSDCSLPCHLLVHSKLRVKITFKNTSAVSSID